MAAELAPVLLAGQYLLDDPPKKLVILNGDSKWELPGRQGQFDAGFLIEWLRRARNNLFHGGKWLTAPEPRDRNELVSSTGARVLSAVMNLPSAYSLRQHFEDL